MRKSEIWLPVFVVAFAASLVLMTGVLPAQTPQPAQQNPQKLCRSQSKYSKSF